MSLGLDLAAGFRQASGAATTGSAATSTITRNPLFNSPSASTSAQPIPPPAMSEQHPSGPTTDSGWAPPYDSVPASEPSVPTLPSGLPLAQGPRSVVPVIIVGLQSVHPEWRPNGPLPTAEDEELEPPVDASGNTDLDGSEDDITFAPDPALGIGGSRARGRTRGWQSRAANAFRNLRPGRRDEDGRQPTALPPPSGSRTFLIYVIGGYYPPDHSIVTGGPNNFDSFEALLYILFNLFDLWLISIS